MCLILFARSQMSINYKNLVFIVIPIIILGLGITVILSIAQNNKFYVVFSDSMVPNINTGDIVMVAKEDGSRSSFANLKIGEVIVFLPPSQNNSEAARSVVHRVVEIETDSDGTRLIRTKGDANADSIQALDYPITEQNYNGKVSHVIPHLGPLLMYFDLIVRVFVHPLLYIIIGVIIAVIFVFELRKRQSFLRNLNE
jgi:signal peptidase I